jgi:hypothetical protein
MGLGSFALSAVTSFVGIFAVLMMHCYKGDKPWTDYDAARHYSKIHSWLGYALLIFANATCMSGVTNYVQRQIK